MAIVNEDLFFKASAKVIIVFEKTETLMSLCLKSKVSYPFVSRIMNDLREYGIIVRDEGYNYRLTSKGEQLRELLARIRKQFNIIVKTPQIDGDLQGGLNGRKTKRK